MSHKNAEKGVVNAFVTCSWDHCNSVPSSNLGSHAGGSRISRVVQKSLSPVIISSSSKEVTRQREYLTRPVSCGSMAGLSSSWTYLEDLQRKKSRRPLSQTPKQHLLALFDAEALHRAPPQMNELLALSPRLSQATIP